MSSGAMHVDAAEPGRASGRPFVGRHAERAAVAALLAGPPHRSTILTIEGDVGIGKSRLLAELARDAVTRGYTVVRGQANQFDSTVPFGLLHDVLAGVDQHDHESARELGRLALYRTVRALLRTGAARRSLLLLVDDLQWADDATVGFLVHLMRHPVPGPIAIVLAHRTGQCPPRLALHLGRSKPAPIHLPLGPLSADDVDTWLSATPAHRRRALHAASGGNPLFLEILAAADTTDSADDRIAAAVDTRIGAELRALPAVERLTVQAAAVIGDGGEPGVLAHAAQLSVDAVVGALDALIRRGLLCEAPGGVAFSHPLIRVAADRTSGSVWRRAVQDRISADGRADRRPVIEPLSDREREVAAMLAEGLSNRAIAGRLYLSPRTVESHVARIFAKLGVSTRAAVARHVVLAG